MSIFRSAQHVAVAADKVLGPAAVALADLLQAILCTDNKRLQHLMMQQLATGGTLSKNRCWCVHHNCVITRQPLHTEVMKLLPMLFFGTTIGGVAIQCSSVRSLPASIMARQPPQTEAMELLPLKKERKEKKKLLPLL